MLGAHGRLRAPRALVSFASLAASHPIEAIVCVFIACALAYFHLVHAVAHSTLLSDKSICLNASELDQSAIKTSIDVSCIYRLDKNGTFFGQPVPQVDSAARTPDQSQLVQWHVVIGDKADESRVYDFAKGSYAYGTRKPGFLKSSRADAVVHVPTGDNDTVAYAALTPDTARVSSNLDRLLSDAGLQDSHIAEYIDPYHQSHARLKVSPAACWNSYSLRQAVPATLRRFEHALKNSDTLDFSVVLAAYLLMHSSFVSLYMSMRRFRSKFWLGTGVLLSSTLAFLIALAAAHLLGVRVDPVLLSEAIPFLVITVGFEKPFVLTRAIFEKANAGAPCNASKKVQVQAPTDVSTAESRFVAELTRRVQQEQSRQMDTELPPVRFAAKAAINHVGGDILCGYAIELGVLAVGIISGVAGLREFCILAALILAFDCILLFSFYTAIVCVLVETQRLRPSQPGESAPGAPAEPRNVRRMSWLSSPTTGESPLPHLKLLLLVTVITLSSFNLLSTLTLSSGSKGPHTLSPYEVVFSSSPNYSARIENAPYKAVLNTLAAGSNSASFIPTPPHFIVLFNKNGTARGPVMNAARAHHTSATGTDPLGATTFPSFFSQGHTGTLSALDSFLSAWTRIVSDTVAGKWLSILLVISLFLNTFLIKGIATRSKAVIDGNAVHATAHAAARLLGAHLIVERESHSAANSPKRSPTAEEIAAARAQHDAVPDDLAGGALPEEEPVRPYETMVELLSNNPAELSDTEAVTLVQRGALATYALEKKLGDMERAVRIRRAVISRASAGKSLETSALPYRSYNYGEVFGACCENVVGYMPIPLGIAGPLVIDGELLPIPMATTEGTLVASTSRGCKALNTCGGVSTVLTQDAMTRGPVIEFSNIASAASAKRWLDSPEGSDIIREAFNSTSRFARLSSLRSVLAGRTLFVRFATSTGDAMGMNMISKGVEKALRIMKEEHFPEMQLLALSGNYCTDKKPAAINWVEGRGKSVVAEAVLRGDVVRSVLKCTVSDLARLNLKKNLVGSAMAGSVGGFNAHASNILTAIYLATGQDPAQNVESSTCITQMEPINDGADLLVTVSMPSIEVGTVGGGTILSAQGAMLDMLGIRGANRTTPGANAQRLARVISAAVMAGELSLMAALAAGHLIQAHMKHNRSVPATPGTFSPASQETSVSHQSLSAAVAPPSGKTE